MIEDGQQSMHRERRRLRRALFVSCIALMAAPTHALAQTSMTAPATTPSSGVPTASSVASIIPVTGIGSTIAALTAASNPFAAVGSTSSLVSAGPIHGITASVQSPPTPDTTGTTAPHWVICPAGQATAEEALFAGGDLSCAP